MTSLHYSLAFVHFTVRLLGKLLTWAPKTFQGVKIRSAFPIIFRFFWICLNAFYIFRFCKHFFPYMFHFSKPLDLYWLFPLTFAKHLHHFSNMSSYTCLACSIILLSLLCFYSEELIWRTYNILWYNITNFPELLIFYKEIPWQQTHHFSFSIPARRKRWSLVHHGSLKPWALVQVVALIPSTSWRRRATFLGPTGFFWEGNNPDGNSHGKLLTTFFFAFCS